MKSLFVILTVTLFIQDTSFKEKQLSYPRVKTAFREKSEIVRSYFINKQLSDSGYQLFIRVFKREEEMEVWVRERQHETYSLLVTYPFCSSSGVLGPKRKEGDLQIPEGVYYVNHFNPVSNFYLSLGINYPNASDKILSDKTKPGGLIYIHGGCVTIGCIPISDEKIKELYLLAVEACAGGQMKIPVHIFPTRLTRHNLNRLTAEFNDPVLTSFWNNLKDVYVEFEKSHQLRNIQVNNKGQYYLAFD